MEAELCGGGGAEEQEKEGTPPPLGTDGHVCEVEGTDGNNVDKSPVSGKEGALACGAERKAAEDKELSAPKFTGAECREGKLDTGEDKGFELLFVGAAISP